MRTLRSLLLVSVTTLLGVGCAAKMADESYSPSMAREESMAGAAMGYGGGGGDGGYDDADMYAEAEREYAAEMDMAPGAPMPEPAPADGSVATPDQPSDPGEVNTGGDEEPSKHGRQIIYTASMRVAVYNVAEAMEVAEAMPEAYGGWMHNRSEGYITMKIPAAKLKDAMKKLAELGVVEARNLQASDVTAEYVDLESRIKVLKSTQKQLLALLEQAKTVEEALHVRQALDKVNIELETALGRMRQLKSSIAFSTLTLELIERGPYQQLPTSNDPFPWVDELGVEATEFN